MVLCSVLEDVERPVECTEIISRDFGPTVTGVNAVYNAAARIKLILNDVIIFFTFGNVFKIRMILVSHRENCEYLSGCDSIRTLTGFQSRFVEYNTRPEKSRAL